jgi:excisionase family DNA binding protein
MTPRQAAVADGFLTVPEVADLLRSSRSAIYKAMDAGEIPWLNIVDGGKRLIPRRPLLDALAKKVRGL